MQRKTRYTFRASADSTKTLLRAFLDNPAVCYTVG